MDPPSTIPSNHYSDILAKLVARDDEFETFKDILIDTQFQMKKIKDAMKETSSDVVKIHVKLDRVIEEAIKVGTSIQAIGEGIATNLATKFDNLKEATVNTICYLFRK